MNENIGSNTEINCAVTLIASCLPDASEISKYSRTASVLLGTEAEFVGVRTWQLEANYHWRYKSETWWGKFDTSLFGYFQESMKIPLCAGEEGNNTVLMGREIN